MPRFDFAHHRQLARRGGLASYAMAEERSQGRRSPEPAHPYRSEYQRDRDRIVHSRAFRRLEAKTQVFTRRFSDHFRNRLTHTLEVSQIARTIGGALGLNVDLCEALALAHDIGHPPFAHAGESRLDELMQAHGDSFDHNLHALRIVENFEQRYADFPGLNLTFEVREGLIKHSRDYDPARFPELARQGGLAEYWLERQPPLESQLIDLADEVAYNTADLDDGYEAKLLDFETVVAATPLVRAIFAAVRGRYPRAPEKLQFNETLKRVIDRLVTDLIESTRTQLAGEGIETLEAVRNFPRRLVGFSAPVAEENRQLKRFLFERLYSHPSLVAEREQAVKALGDLFQFYLEHPERLPRFYFEKTRTARRPYGHRSPSGRRRPKALGLRPPKGSGPQVGRRAEPVHRVVCDYIAGMTDTYVFRQHRELFEPSTSRRGQ
ncbi:MAG: deoxyguanosinetriphosphate triphosphohydrolase [Terriglobia bacterium]